LRNTGSGLVDAVSSEIVNNGLDAGEISDKSNVVFGFKMFLDGWDESD
jgi:hypothetical protein